MARRRTATAGHRGGQGLGPEARTRPDPAGAADVPVDPLGSFNDRFDARIESDKGDSLQGRVGIALDYKRDWQSGGVHREASVYGVANVKHEFLDGTRVRVANVPVASRMARTWGGWAWA